MHLKYWKNILSDGNFSWLCWLLTIRYFGFFIETQKIKFISNESVYAKSQCGINFGSRSPSSGVHSILNTMGYIPGVFILIYNKSHPGSCMSVNQRLGWRVQSVCEETCEAEPTWDRKYRRLVVQVEENPTSLQGWGERPYFSP